MKTKGVLVILSGFSGSGKGTVVKELVKKYNDDYCLSISATTRKARTGEEHGREYFFLTKDEFEGMIEDNEFIEYAKYVSNYYGTPKKYVEEQLEKGYNVILEIEMQGALKVKEQLKDTLMIFLVPPNFIELKDRLVNRKTEDMDTINKRLDRAVEETEYIDKYDHIVVNNQVEDCVEEIHEIIMNEKKKRAFIEKYIEDFKNDYKEFKKGEI